MSKTVYITDAGSAIAAAIAKRFAGDGMNLSLNNPCPELLKELDGMNARYITTAENLLTVASAARAVQKTAEAFGGIDALVHTNNRIERSCVEYITDEDFDKQFGANALTAFMSAREFGAYMGKAGGGKVLFISSIHDNKPTGSAAAYSIAKGAVGMLNKECALQLGHLNVQCNLIELGAFEGDEEQLISEELSGIYQRSETRVPMQRLGKPEDITALCALLVSDGADFINGASIRVDGGFEFFYGYR